MRGEALGPHVGGGAGGEPAGAGDLALQEVEELALLLPRDAQARDPGADAEAVVVGEGEIALVGLQGLGLLTERLQEPGAQPPAGAGVLALGEDGVADDQSEVQLVVVTALQGLVGDGEQGVEQFGGDAGGGARGALDGPLEQGRRAGRGGRRRGRGGGRPPHDEQLAQLFAEFDAAPVDAADDLAAVRRAGAQALVQLLHARVHASSGPSSWLSCCFLAKAKTSSRVYCDVGGFWENLESQNDIQMNSPGPGG